MVTTPLSPLAESLRAFVAEQRSVVIALDELRAHAHSAHPYLTDDPAARDRLRAALHEIADAGHVSLPSPRTRTGWDRAMAPPLPAWVKRIGAPRAPVVTPVAARVWPARLEKAAAIDCRPDELELLDKIARWMRGRPAPAVVPMEERSLEIFGNEKLLSSLTAQRLFTSGALTLDLLACHPTPTPLPSTHIAGVGPTRLLVCENRAAYFSAATAARRLHEHQRPDLHVAFGGGGQFSVSHDQIAFLEPAPVRLYYCGDLDKAGLTIARHAADRYAHAATPDKPLLEPAVSHYEWMLDHGHRQRDKSNAGGLEQAADLLAWFPEQLRDPISTLLAAGEKVSQETIGLDALTTVPRLITHI